MVCVAVVSEWTLSYTPVCCQTRWLTKSVTASGVRSPVVT